MKGAREYSQWEGRRPMKYRKLKNGDKIGVNDQILLRGEWHNLIGFVIGSYGVAPAGLYRRPIAVESRKTGKRSIVQLRAMR